MATVNVAFAKISNFNGTAVNNPEFILGESVTSSGTSQQSVGAALDYHEVVRVAVAGGNVWIRIGNNPTAAVGDDILLIDGDTEYFSVNTGDKVAIIDG